MENWQKDHNAALSTVVMPASTAPAKRLAEAAIVAMYRGWLRYATAHENMYGSAISEDGVLGPKWEAIGKSLRGLLNGETGRLDCGTVDGEIVRMLGSDE